MVDLLLKSINPYARICVSNLKDEIQKVTLAKIGNNVKDLLDDMSSNYSIIIDKRECHEDFVRQIFRALFTGPNSTFNRFIQRTKDDWYMGEEVPEGELSHNATQKYNDMVAGK